VSHFVSSCDNLTATGPARSQRSAASIRLDNPGGSTAAPFREISPTISDDGVQ
jgi:hypothetical protein